MTHHGYRCDVESFSRFFYRHAAEVTHLNDLCLEWVDLGKACQGFVKGDYVSIPSSLPETG